MSVSVRPFRGKNSKGKWEVDIRFEWPDGETYRERVVAPGSSMSAARKWGEARERERLVAGKAKPQMTTTEEGKQPKPPAPRISEFRERYITEHCKAERQKPSTIWNKEQIFRTYLIPLMKDPRLDEITNVDVQKFKGKMAHLSVKSVNNALTVLSVMLKKAVEWGVIETMPCSIKLLKYTFGERPFYDLADYERLLEGAKKVGGAAEVMVLLGGDAGLRLGEILGLKWHNVLFDRRLVRVAESEWRGHTTLPKGGRSRDVPMTERLFNALKAHRHMRGAKVFYGERGEKIEMRTLRTWMEQVERRGGFEVKGRLHILRHTFCSHLAILGAPAKAIQELAGHADLTTTMRYMHLSPAARASAIALLDKRGLSSAAGASELLLVRGDLGETRGA